LLAQVFDHFSDTESDSLDILKNSDWLFGPRSMHKWPNLRKDTGWKSLGILSAPEDDFVPDFKGVQVGLSIVEDESKIGPWYPIHDLTRRGEDCEYKNVKHLERKILTTSSLGLVWRTGMEYCRLNGLVIKDYYDLEEEGRKNMYYQMINIPLYKEIPKEIRGRALNNASQKK